MKAKFTLTTSSSKPTLLGLTPTPLLILGKLQAVGLGSHIQSLDHSLGGAISEQITGLNFRGERGESFLLDLDQEGAPDNVLVVGLGSVDKFDQNAIKQVVELAIAAAVSKGLTKITFPMPPNRQTTDINLRGQANREEAPGIQRPGGNGNRNSVSATGQKPIGARTRLQAHWPGRQLLRRRISEEEQDRIS